MGASPHVTPCGCEQGQHAAREGISRPTEAIEPTHAGKILEGALRDCVCNFESRGTKSRAGGGCRAPAFCSKSWPGLQGGDVGGTTSSMTDAACALCFFVHEQTSLLHR